MRRERERERERGGEEGKMAYFERKRKRILALSGLTTNKARDMVLRIIIEYTSFKGFCNPLKLE
jgi:hypothetical protein